MFITVLFFFSGLALAVIMLAKRFQEKKRKTLFILHLVSRGDERVRELHHQAVRFYSTGKEKAAFFVKKRLPMRSKHSLNKLVSRFEEQVERYIGNIRGSKMLNKPDGISEFFKNL